MCYLILTARHRAPHRATRQATGREGKEMTKREKERISKTIEGLKAQAGHMDSERDRENLLNRADALEWVLSIAE